MQILKNEHITLRALEPEDIQFLFENENNESFWEISNTQTPFSKAILKNYISNAHLDIYEAKQLRLIIEDNKSKKPIGMIDLFNYDPKHLRAGIGILIIPEHEGNGFAFMALKLLINYSFKHLNLRQLYANVTEDNNKSIQLFEKLNFIKAGIKKDWIFYNNHFKNEILYQLINNKDD